MDEYLGVGLGYYNVEIDDNVRGDVDRLGARFSFGVDWSNNWFLEANYHLLGKRSGLNFNRFGVSLGYRF